MTTYRTVVGAALAAVVASLLVVLATSPAQAEPKQLLVAGSAQGPFRDNLATPLFAGTGRLVPLDSATSTFYVKNNGKQTARTTVAVVNRGGSNAFEDALTLDVDIDGTASVATVPAPGGKGCSLVTTGPSLAPGAVQAVDIGLTVADLDGQVGMDQAASLDVVVTLSQVGPRGQVKVCGEQATAEPEVKGEQATDGGDADGEAGGDGVVADCARDVVVTVAGDPTCVPTAVAAGRGAAYGGGEPRDPATVAGLAGLLAAAGASLVLWAGRRRRRVEI